MLRPPAEKLSRGSSIVCSPVRFHDDALSRIDGSRGVSQRSAAPGDGHMSLSSCDDTIASSRSHQTSGAAGGKSLFELAAFEKSLEYLSKVWEKDKKRAAKSRAAKQAFVAGRQALPVCQEEAGTHADAGGKQQVVPLIFSPHRAPKARTSARGGGAASSLAAAGCGWDVESKVNLWLNPSSNPWENSVGHVETSDEAISSTSGASACARLQNRSRGRGSGSG